MLKKIVTLALLGTAACSTEPAQKQAREAPATVSYVTVANRQIDAAIAASGVLVAREEAAVLPELSGYRVLRVLADEGDRVERGQPLAILDGTLLGGELARARAEVTSAEVAAERARSEYARVADLVGSGVVADETIAQRGFEARAASAQLQSARASLQEADARRGRLTLRAPVAGMVLQRSIRPGDVAGTGNEAPFRIARDGRFELEAEVPERQLSLLTLGADVRVTLASGEQLAGTIRLVSPRVDAATRLGRVRIVLPSHPSLRLGGFATASIGTSDNVVRAVPSRAISFEGGPSVVTVDGQGRTKREPVRTGMRGSSLVELIEGPPVGTRVLLGGGALVVPGDVVNAVKARQ